MGWSAEQLTRLSGPAAGQKYWVFHGPDKKKYYSRSKAEQNGMPIDFGKPGKEEIVKEAKGQTLGELAGVSKPVPSTEVVPDPTMQALQAPPVVAAASTSEASNSEQALVPASSRSPSNKQQKMTVEPSSACPQGSVAEKKRKVSSSEKDSPDSKAKSSKKSKASPASTPSSKTNASIESSDSTPEKPEDLEGKRTRGYGGKTAKAETCWICDAPRDVFQRGTLCTYCAKIARLQLNHQRFHELKADKDALAKVKTESLKKQGRRKSSQSTAEDVESLKHLVARLEVLLPKMEALLFQR